MTVKGLDKAKLQLAAAAFMLTDHLAFLVPIGTAYYAMQLVGRITVVIMSFFIAEGYHRTSNLKRYIIRMAVFAAVSQIPYYLFSVSAMPGSFWAFASGMYHKRNVIFTLLVGLCLLSVLKSERLHIAIKLISVPAALWLVRFSDWRYFCVLWVIGFGLLRGKKTAQMCACAAVVLLRTVLTLKTPLVSLLTTGQCYVSDLTWAFVQLGGLFAIPLLMLYNGEKGRQPKYFFYIFYPLHLLALAILRLALA